MELFGIKLWGSKQKKASIPLQSTVTTSLNFTDGRRLSVTEMYTGWVAKCIKAISEEVGGIELVLYRRKGNQEIVVTDHPVLDLLKYVNNFFTRYQLFERLQANLELYGNEYWYLQKDKKTKLPKEIYPLMPGSVVPVKGEFYVDHYEYSYLGKKISLGLDDVIHFKTFNPYSNIIGLSTVEIARTTIETDIYSKEYNRKFFVNDATPGGVLKAQDEIDQVKADQIRDKWHETFGGYSKAFKTAVLGGGLDYTTIQPKHADMQFIEQSKMNRDDILAMFGVPKTVLGIVEDVNFASAYAANYVFSSRTIYPKEKRIADYLNEFLIPLFGEDDMWFVVKSPVQEDKLQTTQVDQILFSNGQLSTNEWRKRNGLSSVDNGDQLYLPFSLSPYTRVSEQKAVEPKTPLTKAHEEIKKTILNSLQVFKLKDGVVGEKIETKIPEEVEPVSHSNSKRFQLVMDPHKFESLGQKLNGAMRNREEPYIKKMQQIMVGIFNEQRENAVNVLEGYMRKKSKSQKAKLPEFIDKEKQVKITIDLVTPLMAEFVSTEGQHAFATLGLRAEEFDLHAPDVRKYLISSIKKFANEITENTSNMIRQQVADGLESGEGLMAISSRIRDLADLSDNRAELIATTEIHRSQGHAEIEAWNQSKVVVAKIWYTALDERVCPECSLMHGKEVDLDEAFLSVEELADLGYKNYDGPVEIAQMHPRCRCSIIPVIKGQ